MSRFTKNAIEASFLSLAAKKPIRRITVRDVTEHCGVNRNTFYYHYSDVYALLDSILREKGEEAGRTISETGKVSAGLAVLLDFVKAHPDAMRSVYDALGRDRFVDAFSEPLADALRDYVAAREEGGAVREGDLSIVSDALLCVCTDAVAYLARTGEEKNGKVTPEQLDGMLDAAVRGALGG